MAPHNLDAEEHVLGAILLSGAAIDAVRQELDPADFYRESHTRIYRAALTLHQLGQPVDGITVAARLEEQGQLEQAGGAARVHELAALTPATSNVAHHARIVAREARRRAYLRLGETLIREALQSQDPDLLHDHATELLYDAAAGRGTTAAPHKVQPLDDFLDVHEETAEALTGDPENTLLPAGGLLILGGEGGASKTTLTLDAIAHLASGTPWLGYPVNRPLRILIIENEGPRPQFRAKLKAKADTWTGADWHPNVHVWEEPWASFSFAREPDRQALRDTAQDLQLDLVVADPLDSLGVIGAGTPEDTRTFIGWLRDCGLHNPHQPLAFWLLHHFNKTGARSVIGQLSGAWGGHPDAILGVELGDNQTTKLTWGKLRHATPPANRTILLAWNLDTRGFTPLEQRPPADTDAIRKAVLLYVNEHHGEARTTVEEAVYQGVTGSRKDVRTAIDWLLSDDGATQLAIGRGAAPNGKYLYPASALVSPLAEPLFGEHGEHSHEDAPEPARRQLAASNGEHGEQPYAVTPPAQLAGPPPLSKERGAGGEHRQQPPETSSPPPRRALTEAEAWIDRNGWMHADPSAELLERWPTLGTHDLRTLLDRAQHLAEAES